MKENQFYKFRRKYNTQGLIFHLKSCDNNLAATALGFFEESVRTYGIPNHVRGDHCTENTGMQVILVKNWSTTKDFSASGGMCNIVFFNHSMLYPQAQLPPPRLMHAILLLIMISSTFLEEWFKNQKFTFIETKLNRPIKNLYATILSNLCSINASCKS